MYEFSKNIGEVSNVNINIRKEFDSLQKSFAINIIYLRNHKFVRCSCFNDLEKAGDPDCPKCFGSGYFASMQKIKTIESSLTSYSGNDKVEVTPIGGMNNKEEVYYLKYDILPKERDFILKTTWDSKGIAVDVVKVLEIVNVFEMRGDNGRVELFGVQVQERADLTKVYDKVLHLLPYKAKNILLKGGKYVWPYKLLN